MQSPQGAGQTSGQDPRRRTRIGALWAALAYVAAGSLWIAYSDRVLVALISDPATLTELQTYKGWLFVAVTAFFLYLLLRMPMAEAEFPAPPRRDATRYAWRLRWQLLALGLTIAVPLVLLAAFTMYRAAVADARQAGEAAIRLAGVAAANAEASMLEARRLLGTLARRPSVAALDRDHCDPILMEIPKLHPRFRNALTVNREGELTCSAAAVPTGSQTQFGARQWFKQVRAREQFTVGAPALDTATGRQVVTLAHPLRDALGDFSGAIALPVDLTDFRVPLTGIEVPQNAAIGIATDSGAVIALSPDLHGFDGQNAIDSSIRSAALAENRGQIEVVGVDGIRRIYGFMSIPGTRWYAFAGLPASSAYAASHAASLRSALLACALLLLVALAAYAVGRRIEQPLHGIAAAAAAVARGNRAVRAPLYGSREAVALAGQFNDMLDALEAGERRFRETLKNLQLIAVALDVQGNVTFCNDFLLKLTGWSREELLGRNFFDMLVPDPAPVRAVFERAIRDGSVAPQYENEIHTRQGEHRIIRWSNTVLRDVDNRVVGTVSLGEDITERKQAEEALRESEQRFRLAVSTGNVWDWNFSTEEVSFPAEHWHALEFAETDGKFTPAMVEWIMHPDDRPRWRQAIKDHITQRVPYDLEFRARTKSGEYRWFNTKGQARWDEHGRAIYMAGTTFDITQRKQAEQALRESEQRLRLALNSARLAAWEWTIASDTLVWSESPRWLLGPEPPGGYTDFRELVHPEDRARFLEAGQAAISLETPYYAVFRIVRTDGLVRWVEAHGVFLDNEGGHGGDRIIGVSQDVTERKRQENEMRRLNENLERLVDERTHALKAANRELEAFSYSVSHDLRAPLRAINGFVHILEDEYATQLGKNGAEMVARMRAGAERMSRLIDDLLLLSQISRQTIRVRQVDLSALAREVADELQERDADRRVEWTIAPGIIAEGDEGLLKVVLENLLGNAWKYSSKRETARIEFAAGTRDGRAMYFVRDNGAGFDMAYAQKLFGAFQRLHSATEYPGSGIGLATVARIIRRHGGEVWAEAHLEAGASFYFTLAASPNSP